MFKRFSVVMKKWMWSEFWLRVWYTPDFVLSKMHKNWVLSAIWRRLSFYVSLRCYVSHKSLRKSLKLNYVSRHNTRKESVEVLSGWFQENLKFTHAHALGILFTFLTFGILKNSWKSFYSKIPPWFHMQLKFVHSWNSG